MSVKQAIPFTASTSRAVAKYGAEACSRAYTINTHDGEGASTILHCYDCGYKFTTVGQVDAAINAGRELYEHRTRTAKNGTAV